MNAKNLVILLAAIVVVVGVVVHNRSNKINRHLPVEQPELSPAKPRFQPRLPAPRMAAAGSAIESPADEARPASLLARLLNGDEAFKLNSLQVESYLQANRRSAESLLAAYRATDDPALLREALEKYPDNP